MSDIEFLEIVSKYKYMYVYDLPENISYKDYINIYCDIHGTFSQSVPGALKGNKCINCHKESKSLDKYKIINRSNIIHNNKYDYSELKDGFIKRKDYIEIICPIHGRFRQVCGNHLSGRGCRKCDFDSRRNNIENVVLNLGEKHNFKYKYIIESYKNNRDYITIICPIHGNFKQKIITHLNGFGCSICGGSKRLTNDEFIEKSNAIHNNTYCYDKSEYINTETKIIIICKKHGEFTQTPHSHMFGIGCPSCSSSSGEKKIMYFLTSNNIKYDIQKKFTECKNIKRLPFDFYLPDYNICVEYDGKQHFQPIEYFGGIESFLKTKKRDEIKNKYCEDNNIKLIRIPYWDFDNIEYIIRKELVI